MHTALLILAAGMGSRYGGMKQVDAFGPSGETITDYSIYDAIRAGFERFVFVISPKMEEDFKTNYIKKFPSHLKVDYVIQSLDLRCLKIVRSHGEQPMLYLWRKMLSMSLLPLSTRMITTAENLIRL